MDYVCENYNLGNYNVVVYINTGTYEENLSLPQYTTGIGNITITRYSNINVNTVTIKNRSSGSTIALTKNSEWVFRGINISYIENLNNITSRIHRYPISVGNGHLIMTSCIININQTGSLTSGGQLRLYPIHSYNTGIIEILPSTPERMELNLPEYVPNNNNIINCVNAAEGGRINFPNGKTGSNGEFKVSGNFTCFAVANEGSMHFGSGQPVPISFVDGIAVPTGKRYEAISNGKINTGGQGPDFFPGTIAGTAESATYSWYK